jgi:hypothetical protein
MPYVPCWERHTFGYLVLCWLTAAAVASYWLVTGHTRLLVILAGPLTAITPWDMAPAASQATANAAAGSP